ncbi:MAG: glycosyltransferase [Muribaculaceae bacterium]|nr:glycosyltransferase [Muribaculaceae bacterium]
MKVAVLCRSDSRGGAAVVSRRLTEALRSEGVDATLLVLEKSTDLPYVVEARYPLRARFAFAAGLLRVLLANGLRRRNLFKVDAGEFGLPLWRHPVVRNADVVILNWVNQGMLSLKGVRRIAAMGKRVIWTMHDMWPMTGICHHAMGCRRFEQECGCCPLLGSSRPGDLSHKVWRRKKRLYDASPIQFVAVSSWLAAEGRLSSLLGAGQVEVVPNAIREVGRGEGAERKPYNNKEFTILFAAATLDNWIKGLDTFREAVAELVRRHPEVGARCRVLLIGGVKRPAVLEGFALPMEYLGVVSGERELAAVYSRADVIVNTSSFENLPGTLVEGQLYGAVPVAFDRGGQRDIITHGETGWLADWSDSPAERAAAIADGIARAVAALDADAGGVREKMRNSVESRFSYSSVSKRYIQLSRLS